MTKEEKLKKVKELLKKVDKILDLNEDIRVLALDYKDNLLDLEDFVCDIDESNYTNTKLLEELHFLDTIELKEKLVKQGIATLGDLNNGND